MELLIVMIAVIAVMALLISFWAAIRQKIDLLLKSYRQCGDGCIGG